MTDLDERPSRVADVAEALRQFPKSRALWEEASRYLPGGIPGSSGGFLPVYFERSAGEYTWDVDGNRYLDMVSGMNALPVGSSLPEVRDAIVAQAEAGYYVQAPFPQVIDLARELCERWPSADKVQFIESATKAANLAVRLGRAFSGRDRFAKFVGGYHGVWDGALQGPSMRYTQNLRLPGNVLPGVPRSGVDEVVLLPWNEPEICARILNEQAAEVGTLIMEPVMGDGFLPPVPGFLQMLRELCTELGIVLVFDEAITQTLAPGGAQERFGVVPDLTVIAKGAVGGGLPLAAVGGREEIVALAQLRAKPPVPHGSTFATHALTVAAGLAQLRLMTPAFYARLDALGDRLRTGIVGLAEREGWEELQVTGLGNVAALHWRRSPVVTYADHEDCDTGMVESFYGGLMREFCLSAGSKLRVSASMTDDDIDGCLAALERVVKARLAAGHR